MELGTLQIQIFVSLVVVLGTAFVAFLCDFLKGNNEQLRERNIELRVRQDERERMGIAHPGSLLKGIEALLRNTPGLRMAPPDTAAPATAEPATGAPEAPQPSTWEQPIVAPAAKVAAWASKEELEKLAERAARIRERHEARKSADEPYAADSSDTEPSELAPVTEMPVAAFAGLSIESEPATSESAAIDSEPAAGTPETILSEVPTASIEELYASLESALPAPADVEPTAGTEPTAIEIAADSNAPEAPALDAAAFEGTESATPFTATEPATALTGTEPAAAFAATEPAAPAASDETPPPLLDESQLETPASAEAEAVPVFEPPAEVTVEDPASQIELQPPAELRIESSDTPHAAITSIEDVPAAFAPGPELVKMPVAAASLIEDEPLEPVESAEAVEPTTVAPSAEPGIEPELLRVRVVPIDQSESEIDSVPEAAAETVSLPVPEAASDAPAEASKPEPEAQPLALAAVETPATQQPEAPAAEEPEPVAAVEPAEEPVTHVADLENAAAIGSLHESLIQEEAGLPAGIHPVELLREQIKANAPFQGVAVSIGINDFEGLKQKLDTPGGADSLAAIEKMIRGMLKERDFACRFQDDEYILLFPGEADSAAQRRLFQISEKLWDFQLRSLGHHSIMFSWGGLEVKRDSLSDAVAAARERMFQTKRNRTGAIEMRKRVVNG